MDERIGSLFYQSCGNRGNVGRVSVFGLRWCRWEVGRGLYHGLEGRGGVVYVQVVSPDNLCIWQVQVSVYCHRRLCVVCVWTCLDITRFCEEQRLPSSASAWPACPKNGKSSTIVGGERFDIICTAVCQCRDSSIACMLCRLEIIIVSCLAFTM